MQARLPTAAEVERAVASVYTRPEFNRREGMFDWFWRFVRRMFARLGEAFRWLDSLQGTNPVLFWIIIGWLALSAVAIVVHLLYTAYRAAKQGDGEADAAPGRAKAPRAKTAADWEEEARRAAAAGRLREAALALYQAILLRLDARGAVRFDPSKTPGDYRREARAHPDAARALGAFLRGFEPVAFGNRPLDPSGYDQLRAAAGEAGARG